jgi:Effector-associated domain 11
MIFTERIEKLLAANQLRDVIDEFLRFLNEVPHSDRDARNDANQLRGQVILLSGQFTDLNTKMNSSTIDPSLANRERSTIINSFIQILNQLPSSYPDLNNYITEKNEDDEWKEAQQKNTIEEYQDYFSKYPNGRYKEETIKLITKLEDIKTKQELEMKQVAAREKERRENDKAAETIPQKPAYQQPKTQQAYRSTNTVIAAPAKSRTGLYIALGALLGIIFIIIIAVAVSGSDETTSDTKKTVPAGELKNENKQLDPATQSYVWPANEEYNFMSRCEAKAIEAMSSDDAKQYCNCVLQKLEKSYSSATDAESVLSQKAITQFAAECIPEEKK